MSFAPSSVNLPRTTNVAIMPPPTSNPGRGLVEHHPSVIGPWEPAPSPGMAPTGRRLPLSAAASQHRQLRPCEIPGLTKAPQPRSPRDAAFGVRRADFLDGARFLLNAPAGHTALGPLYPRLPPAAGERRKTRCPATQRSRHVPWLPGGPRGSPEPQARPPRCQCRAVSRRSGPARRRRV